MTQLDDQIQKSVSHLKQEFSTLQVGRANAAIVEDVTVDSYGAMTPLKSVANISCPDAKTIKIEPWDKSLVGAVEKAIQEADIGINPQNMGESIFLPIPPMTEERRDQMVKRVHEMAEQAKISIRNARHDAMKEIKQAKEENLITEDDITTEEKNIQEAVDKANKEIEEIAKNKEQDVKSV